MTFTVDAGLFAVIALGMLGALVVFCALGWCVAAKKADEFMDQDERAYLSALAKSVGPVQDDRKNLPFSRSSRRPVRRRVRLERKEEMGQ